MYPIQTLVSHLLGHQHKVTNKCITRFTRRYAVGKAGDAGVRGNK